MSCAVKHAKLNMHFTGCVKTCHKQYPKAEIERRLEGKPAGSKVVATATVDGVKLIAVGYKYKNRKVFGFI